MTPRQVDWRSVRPKLRKIEELLMGRTGVVEPELAASLRPSAGLRNVLVHAYLEIDPVRVGAAVPLTIRDYTEYVRQVAAWFVARGDAR